MKKKTITMKRRALNFGFLLLTIQISRWRKMPYAFVTRFAFS